MFKCTFRKLSKMGDFDAKYGVTYWGEPNEDLKPVKFNSMNQDISANDTIEAEERVERQSTKGILYYQLKKVKVISGSEGQVSHPPVSGTQGFENPQNAAVPLTGLQDKSILVQLDRIEKKLDLIQETLNKPSGEDVPY